MDISFYLVELLRLHDCVIVPDLGGFIANYRPAEMDLAGNRFKPPVKEIIFTGKLNRNDGLLVNHISETEGVGYMEARRIISEFVDEIWSKLENGEKIEFANIGSLNFDRNGKLIFEPGVHENFLLDAYGLEGFHFPQLEPKDIISAKRVFTGKEAVRPVFISRKVKILAVGIPILLSLIFIPVPKYSWKNNSNASIQTSAINIPVNGSFSASTVVSSDSSVIGKSAVTKATSLQTRQTSAQTGIEPITLNSRARYRVIGGYFAIRQNADNFLSRLQAVGFKSELIVLPNGSFLVIVQSYRDRKEALTSLRSLREAEPQTGYWMSVN